MNCYSLEDIRLMALGDEFLKNMAEKYNLVFMEALSSLYIKYVSNNNDDAANFQVAAWNALIHCYNIYPVCEIKDNEIITSNNEDTWKRAKTNEEFEKYLIEFKKNYKEARLKLKIKTLEKDF